MPWLPEVVTNSTDKQSTNKRKKKTYKEELQNKISIGTLKMSDIF